MTCAGFAVGTHGAAAEMSRPASALTMNVRRVTPLGADPSGGQHPATPRGRADTPNPSNTMEATLMSTFNSIPFTAAGNLTADPELRFTGTGKPVTGLRIAVTPRRYDRDTSTYVDGTTTFVDGQVWGEQAEHLAESLHCLGEWAVVDSPSRHRGLTTRGTYRSAWARRRAPLGAKARLILTAPRLTRRQQLTRSLTGGSSPGDA
jgi:Single-strand binding protein family